MNEERIDELAFVAGCHRHKYWDPKHPDLEGFIISQAVLDKFAGLIVRECLDCIAKVHKTEYTKEFNEGYTLGVERCFYKIEDHFFGVEE